MRIGLLSDTHNQEWAVKSAVKRLRAEHITTVLHAGDVTNAATLALLAGFDAWIARGNCDYELALEHKATALFGEDRFLLLHKLELAGARIALAHGNVEALVTGLVRSGAFDYVIQGHTHNPADDKIGNTRLINPGALGNTLGRVPTFAILNLATGDLEWIEVS